MESGRKEEYVKHREHLLSVYSAGCCLYYATIVDTWHYTFASIQITCSTRMNSNANYITMLFHYLEQVKGVNDVETE